MQPGTLYGISVVVAAADQAVAGVPVVGVGDGADGGGAETAAQVGGD